MGYYQLNDDGTKKLVEGYDMNHGEQYESLVESNVMSEANVDALHEKYHKIGVLHHIFIPFVIDGEDVPAVDKSAKDELSDDEVKEIMKENYSKLEHILLEENIDDLYKKHHTIEEAQSIWDSGIDPNSPFYQDLYELFYRKVKDLVAEEGMESLINETFSIYWQPPAPVSFFGPESKLEVLEKNENSFKIKQTKEIGPQDVGGDSYDIVYIVKYVKEDHMWKFAGAEKQK